MIAVVWSLSPLASKVFLSLFFNCLVARTQWSIHILCANMLKAVLHPSLSFKYEAPLYTWKVPIMMKNCYNVHRNFFIRSFIHMHSLIPFSPKSVWKAQPLSHFSQATQSKLIQKCPLQNGNCFFFHHLICFFIADCLHGQTVWEKVNTPKSLFMHKLKDT